MAESVEADPLVGRLRQISRKRLTLMYEAAARAVECLEVLARGGKNPVTAVLNGAEAVEEWAHFPPGDAVDPDTDSQYYYHCHAAHERIAGEHGHFHTFLRPRKLFPTSAPVARADGGHAGKADDAACIAHLIGISSDASGGLVRLFTTKRWVTGETWFDAEAVIRMIDRFAMKTERPSRELNGWVTAIIATFRPQIEDLIRARDEKLAEFAAARPGSDVFEDRALQVTSEMPVNLLTQIRAFETILGGAAR